MNLIPTIECPPTCFQIDRWDLFDGNGEVEWNEHWQNSLADSGIFELDPYMPFSWLVEVSKLTPQMIEILLRKHYGSMVEHKVFSSLEGGYILENGETLLSLPNCCGTLKDIREWQEATEWDKTTELMVWIGHPWLMVSAKDRDHLHFRETEDGCDLDNEFVVDRDELKLAIIDTKKQLDSFQSVLTTTLTRMWIDGTDIEIEDAAKALIYG